MVGLVTHSVEVTWLLDDITMRGTLTVPAGDGRFPAVVMVAGSGPTDRDWCSPLLPGTNGSARLLAEAFADAGIASLRYDKRASGPDVAESARILFGKFSMRSHLDELAAAMGVLAENESVDVARIAGLGNSEGTLHVLHYATSSQHVPLAGLVLLAPPGRPVGEVLLSQFALQATQFPGGAELMPLVEAAAAHYSAGEPMNSDPRLPDSVKMVLASFESPANLPLARELWNEDAADVLWKLDIPTLILIGRKDLQVDATLDGGALERAAAGKDNITIEYPANANHVFKEETRPTSEVLAAPGNGYNEDGTHLDPESLAMILDWLYEVLSITRELPIERNIEK
jgi:pimeloyl-ACP methyl ester carboxylesterase